MKSITAMKKKKSRIEREINTFSLDFVLLLSYVYVLIHIVYTDWYSYFLTMSFNVFLPYIPYYFSGFN